MNGEETTTEQDTFRTRLMDIIAMEYGERHIDEMKNGDIVVRKDGMDVVIHPKRRFATMQCCLTDQEGDYVLIPVERIADYIPNLVSALHVQPSIFLSADEKNYVPHYGAYIEDTDLEDPRWVIRTIDRISTQASVTSFLFWKDPASEEEQEIKVDEMVFDDSESDDECSEDEDFEYTP